MSEVTPEAIVDETFVDALRKLDQMAWEAPSLRPTFVGEESEEVWAHPCPSWCAHGAGHFPYNITLNARNHVSVGLRVKQDGARGYVDESAEGEAGFTAGHIEACLVAGSREPDRPRVRLIVREGVEGRDGARATMLRALYPDEVRELIAVLQHLLKVGADS